MARNDTGSPNTRREGVGQQVEEPPLLLDETIAEEPLLAAESLAEQTGLSIATERTPLGHSAVRWDPRSKPALDLAVRPDWRPYDQIVVPVCVTEGQGGSLNVSVNMATHTQGLEGNDRYFTHYPIGTAARHSWHGWRELEYGIENFLILGIPDGWNDVANLSLSMPGSTQPDHVLLGPITLRQRKRPAGPRMTDAGLFAALDLSLPGLEAVRAAAEAGDYSTARRELAAYYRTRTQPRSIYPSPLRNPVDTRNADRIRDHLILGQPLGNEIDWRANPIGYLEWMHSFNRHGFMQSLVAAYRATKDERYAEELDYLVSSWIRTTPSPVGNNGGGDPAWETLSTAVRCYSAWFDIFYVCKESSHFRDETLIDMVKSFYHHAEHLMEYGVTRHNNWLVVESQVIASIGVLFPEFKRAAVWREEGYRRLVDEITLQVYPDGAHWELSAGYHSMSAQGFTSPYELAKLNGIELPSVYEERVRGMFDYIWRLARPDGSSPSHNDSGSVRSYQQEFVSRGASLFDDATMEWFGTSGARGTPPEDTSHGFLDAGQLVMRSGWQEDARWSLFDVGPYGAGHQHEDALNFEIYADGTLFLCDPGITSYMRERWTEHQRDTAAHNTIMLDGHPQARGVNESHDQHVRSVRDEIFWATGTIADAARARYTSGYRDLDGRSTHERAMVFVRPDYWLIFDEVRDEDGGDEQRLVESLFHFMPMRLQIDSSANRVRTYRQNMSNLELIPLGQEQGLGFEIVCGQTDPVQGWVSMGGGFGPSRENIPAPCVILSQRTRLPFRMGLALCPYASGVNAGVETRQLSVSGDATAYELSHANGTSDLVCYRWAGNGEVGFADYATNGWLAIIRRDAQGQDTAASVAGGSYLTRGSRGVENNELTVEMLRY